jgi:hypothetical protein
MSGRDAAGGGCITWAQALAAKKMAIPAALGRRPVCCIMAQTPQDNERATPFWRRAPSRHRENAAIETLSQVHEKLDLPA